MTAIEGRPGRIAAGVVALVALVGLAVQYRAGMARNGSVLANLWVLARYFTILSNVFLVLVFGGIALGVRGLNRPTLLAWAVLSIALVGVVYGLLLRGLLDLSGGDVLADLLLHKGTPAIAPLVWFFYARKDVLKPHDPWLWASYPAVYAVYALARGNFDGNYAYPFFDVDRLGGMRVAANCLGIGLGFLAAGWAFVRLDRRLGRDPKP